MWNDTWFIVLFNDGTKLKIGGIRLDVKGFVVIRVDEWCVSLDECFHLFESFGVFVFPLECFWCLEQVGEWSECVRAMRPHVSMMSDKSKEGTKLL